MTYIHPTALIAKNVFIEDNVYIGAYCIIGFAPEWKNNEDKDCGVLIKSGTRLTGLVTIDAGAHVRTIIGNNCYLMKHSHVGHDAQIGDNVTISCGAKVGGHATIGSGCNLGLNSVIHQRVKVPKDCMIGASAFVGKKSILKPAHKYAGVPVKELGENKK